MKHYFRVIFKSYKFMYKIKIKKFKHINNENDI